jgi:uncharacterized protein YgiM (DUF1202 family)
MRRLKRSRFSLFIAMAGLMAAIMACGIGSLGATANPTVTITSPQTGSTLNLGQQIVVKSLASNPKGVAGVELRVDGQVINSQVVAPPTASFEAGAPWTPTVAGSHVIEVRAYGVDNSVSMSPQVIVTVAQSTPLAGGRLSSPLITATPVATGAPVTPSASSTSSVSSGTAGSAPVVTAKVALNIRSGPGVAYPAIGGLHAGQSAPITGKSDDGRWWEIVFPGSTSGQGWVSAQPQYSTASNTAKVSVVTAPPSPPPTPTPTFTPSPTPVPATSTPMPPSTPQLKINSFTADHYTIHAGDSVKLRWKVQGADSIRLEHDGASDKVGKDQGDKTYSPAATTVYTLVARHGSNTVKDQLTVTVLP